jgi:hypothetical protein
VNRTLVGEVQSLSTATVLDQPTLELARRFERRSRTYEARALPTELHQPKILEAAGRIALPMICFAGRRLAVLATPPQTLEQSTGIAPVFPDSGMNNRLDLPKSRFHVLHREFAFQRTPKQFPFSTKVFCHIEHTGMKSAINSAVNSRIRKLKAGAECGYSRKAALQFLYW